MTALLQAATPDHTAMADLPRASRALLFHCHGAPSHGRDTLALVTAHEVIHDANGNAHIGPGRVALPADERHLANLLSGRRRKSRVSILPHNLLHIEDGALAWWIPSERRPMLVRDAEGNDHALDVVWPSLVALVVNRRLYLAAIEGDARPDATTPLFHAPLANVYSTCAVCTGSARKPAGQGVNDIPGWNGVITLTWFTHDLHKDVLASPRKKGRRTKQPAGNYRAADFWINRDSAAPAPAASEMTSLGVTLASWIEGIIDTGDDL